MSKRDPSAYASWRAILLVFFSCLLVGLSIKADTFYTEPTTLHINRSNCTNFFVDVSFQMRLDPTNCVNMELIFPPLYPDKGIFDTTNVLAKVSNAYLYIPDSLYIPIPITYRLAYYYEKNNYEDSIYVSFVAPLDLAKKMIVEVKYNNTIMKISLDSWLSSDVHGKTGSQKMRSIMKRPEGKTKGNSPKP